jgi:FAD:protein FMN transferase
MGCLLAACLITTSLHAQQATPVLRQADIMGTQFSVELYGSDPALLARQGDRALDEARRIDRLLSNYRPDSELSIVNRDAARAPIEISSELFQLLETCLAVSRESQGAFDITVGPLMKTWGFFKDSGHLPRPEAVQHAMSHVGYQHVILDSAKRTVYFDTPGVELDPGGVGKGYAVDRMAGVLRQDGVRSALISAGGSSIFGLGAPSDSPQGWLIHIADPKNDEKTIADIRLKNMSLSTSGSYEKFFWADGKVYSHIMDPRTGYPAQGTLSVSVISPKTLDSEIWAKPFFILGAEWIQRHRAKDFSVLLCEDKPGAACRWLPASAQSEQQSVR